MTIRREKRRGKLPYHLLSIFQVGAFHSFPTKFQYEFLTSPMHINVQDNVQHNSVRTAVPVLHCRTPWYLQTVRCTLKLSVSFCGHVYLLKTQPFRVLLCQHLKKNTSNFSKSHDGQHSEVIQCLPSTQMWQHANLWDGSITCANQFKLYTVMA